MDAKKSSAGARPVPPRKPQEGGETAKTLPVTVLAVGWRFPGNLVESIDYSSRKSLLDHDIIIFAPVIWDEFLLSASTFQGKHCLSDSHSATLRESTNHWRREIQTALSAGKTIFVFGVARLDVFIATGQEEYSGTGRNRVTTRMVAPYDNYRAVASHVGEAVTSQGRGVALTESGAIVREYWDEFGVGSAYEVYFERHNGTALIRTRHGARDVGILVRHTDTAGSLVVLPPPVMPHRVDATFRFVSALRRIDGAIRMSAAELPPAWSQADEYASAAEKKAAAEILKLEREIETAQLRVTQERANAAKEAGLRPLLYAKGKRLEAAILEALGVLGFTARGLREGGSEFDAVFESPEGRCLGEAEGRDNKSVSVDKLRQLETNLLEDLDRPDVSTEAKGVLFGNGCRLLPPTERKEFFTQKCFAAARMRGHALVRTPDLFHAAKYVKDTGDMEFARRCREAIIVTKGQEVVFPDGEPTQSEQIRESPPSDESQPGEAKP